MQLESRNLVSCVDSVPVSFWETVGSLGLSLYSTVAIPLLLSLRLVGVKEPADCLVPIPLAVLGREQRYISAFLDFGFD